MKTKNRFKEVNNKIFIIPIVVITLIFLIIGSVTIKSINSYYFNHMKEDSLKFAMTYSRSLIKATEAHDIVNGLLSEKLLVASKATASYYGQYNNELLSDLADILEVDEIDYYNFQGELIYSNIDELIGWKSYEGHPVYDFMMSNNIEYIGDIRQDSVTGDYYKYGYFKVLDGGFVQIGVRADKIHQFLGGFEMQQLLDEMNEIEFVAKSYFIDNEFNIIGSTDSQLIGKKITNVEVRTAIEENKEYGFINNTEDKTEYEVFVPVYLNDNKIGTLVIGQSLGDTESIIEKVSTIGLMALIIIYAFLLYIMFSTHKSNRRLIRLAYYDPLTNLPNKKYLEEFLTEELENKEERNKALILIYLKNLGVANLTYGYEYGDEMLRELSKKMQSLVDDNTILFKFSSGRFLLYVKNYDDQNHLVSITKGLVDKLNNPSKLRDLEYNSNVDVGIVEINSKYDRVDQVLKNVSISLNSAQKNDSLNYTIFNEDMEDKLQREEMIERELRDALSEESTDKLYLEYQPQLDLKTNRIIGFEALARMRTRSLGFVSPLEFISIAEKKQLIIPLGYFILKAACDFIRTLIEEGYIDITVAVNISGIQLLQQNFAETVMKIIKETGIKESNLELEITESILLDNLDTINSRLKHLRDMGIKVSLDDFGTGYSSLSRIRDLNIDCVKIDRSFIRKILIHDHNELITKEIIAMCHKLGYIVVAEGVEVEEEKEYLIKNSCDIMQGYLFSKPLSKSDALKKIIDI